MTKEVEQLFRDYKMALTLVLLARKRLTYTLLKEQFNENQESKELYRRTAETCAKDFFNRMMRGDSYEDVITYEELMK